MFKIVCLVLTLQRYIKRIQSCKNKSILAKASFKAIKVKGKRKMKPTKHQAVIFLTIFVRKETTYLFHFIE